MKLTPRILIALVTMLPTSPFVAHGHGGDANLLHSCLRANGTLRFVAPSGACNANETARDWPTDTAFTTLKGQVTTQGAAITDLQTRVAVLEANQADISVRVFNNADITIPNSVATVLTFNSESWDTDNLHSTAVNTSRLTATTAGKYYIFGHVLWASNANGLRQLRIQMNGSNDIATVGYPAVSDVGVGTFMSVSTHHTLAAGDYVELEVGQLSGGPLNVQVSEGQAGEFGMVKLP